MTTIADSAIARADALSEQFALTAAEVDRTADFPFANFEALRDADLLNLTVPKALGGDGQGMELACRVIERIGKGEPSTALVLAMQYIYQAMIGRIPGFPPHLQEMIARESLEGIALINVMRVEPELGTPSRGGIPATTGARDGDGWRVNGHKLYATGSPILRWFLTFGRTAGDPAEVGYFLIPNDAPGLRIEPTWNHMGMRATGSHDLLLEDARIPADYAIAFRDPATVPPDVPMAGWNNLVLSALYQGVARGARDWLVGYLHERKPANLGAALATLPRHQSAVGEIETLLFANDRLIYDLAAEFDALGPTAKAAGQTTMAKYITTNNAMRVVDIALSLVGNPGLAKANPLERYHRDVLCSRIHSPQDDMVVLAQGKAALGIK